MGTFTLKNKSLFLSIESPGGIYNSNQLDAITKICEDKFIIAKVTEDQRLAIFVKEEEIADIAQKLNATGLGLRHYQQGVHQPTTCIGALCSFAKQDALGTAIKLSETLSKIETTSPLKIGINGCPRNCVPTHTLDISLIGDEDGYMLYLGGKNSQFPEMGNFIAQGIPTTEVATLVMKVVEVYKEHAENDDRLIDVIERVGTSPFIKVLGAYSQDASDLVQEPSQVESPAGDEADQEAPANNESNEQITEDDTESMEEISPQKDKATSTDIEDIAIHTDEPGGIEGPLSEESELIEDEEEIVDEFIEEPSETKDEKTTEIDTDEEVLIEDSEADEVTEKESEESASEENNDEEEEEIELAKNDGFESQEYEEIEADKSKDLEAQDYEEIEAEEEEETLLEDEPVKKSAVFIEDIEEVTEEEIDETIEEMVEIAPEKSFEKETIERIEHAYSANKVSELPNRKSATSATPRELTSVDFSNDHDMVINFSDGTSLQLNIDKIHRGEKTLNIGALVIKITTSNSQVTIAAGDITLSLPRQAA